LKTIFNPKKPIIKMKKLNVFYPLLMLMFAALFPVATAQETTTPVIPQQYNMLENQLERSDKDIEHEKRKTDAKTWLKRAETMMDIYNLYPQYLQPGVQAVQVQIFLGEPNEKKAMVKNGTQLEYWTYDNIEITMEGGVLKSYEVLNPLHAAPLKAALEALKKAEENLDVDKMFGADKDDIKEAYTRLKDLLEISGLRSVQNEEYNLALDKFTDAIEIDNMKDESQQVDTSLYYYGAYSAFYDSSFSSSIKYGEVAREKYYPEPFNYYLLTKSYYEIGDSVKGLEVLKEGFERYPSNQFLINELINYYLVREQAEKALEYIDVAKESDPGNKSYFFAEGTLQDKIGNIEKAEIAYNKAVEIDPDYFDAYYNLSVLFYNHAAELYNKASEEMDDKKYNVLKEQGDEYIEKAIKPMEKALEVNPDSKEAMENLKTFYYRLRGKGDEYQEQYDKYNEMLK